jgi:O-antigen ligase
MIYNILCALIALSLSMIFFGKAVIGIGLGICVILSAIILFQNRDMVEARFKDIVTSRVTGLIVMTFACWFYSAYQGLNPDKAIKETAEVFGLVFGGFIIFSALQTRDFNFNFNFFFKIASGSGALCALWLVLTPWVGEYAVEWGSSYGSVLAIISPMALYCAVSERTRPYLWWVAFVLIGSAIFASGGRTAWLAFGAVMTLSVFFFPWKTTVLRYKNILFLVVLSILSAFSGLKSYEANVGEYVYEVRTEAMTSTDRPMSGRLIVWQDTWNHIQNHLVWGVGIKGVHELEISKGYGELVRHVHNAPLEITLETGFVGLTMFTLTLLVIIIGFLKRYFKSDDSALKFQSLTVFLSVIAYGFAALALTSIFYTWWFLVMVAVLILIKTATNLIKA